VDRKSNPKFREYDYDEYRPEMYDNMRYRFQTNIFGEIKGSSRAGLVNAFKNTFNELGLLA